MPPNLLVYITGPILSTVTAFFSSYHFVKYWNSVDPYAERTRHLSKYFDGGCQKHADGFLCPITKRSVETHIIWQSAAGVTDLKRLQEARLAFSLGQDCTAWFDKDAFVVRVIHSPNVLGIDAPPNTLPSSTSRGEYFRLLGGCVHFSAGCVKAVLPGNWLIEGLPHPAVRAVIVGLRALLSALIFEYIGYYVYWPAGFTKAIAQTASHVVNRHRQSYRPSSLTQDLGTFIHFLAAKEGSRLEALFRVARRPVAALWVTQFGMDTFSSVLYAAFMTEVFCAVGMLLISYLILEIHGELSWLSSRPTQKKKKDSQEASGVGLVDHSPARVEIMDQGRGEQAFHLASALPQYSSRANTAKHEDSFITST